mmetsp:Transcript_6613/g.14071  ORF Transcript_6613/g.14071 Transcript_6613/m.14071 type:complete len:291 (-) Transcript_6613:517-1389(-)
MNATRSTKRSRRACAAETTDENTVVMTTTTTTTTRASPEWLLVTGQPGCGKTTAVKTIVEFLQARGQNCRGFYTDEVLLGDDTTTNKSSSSSSTRIGFDVVSVPDGKRGILSRKAGHGDVSTGSRYKTGQYFVDVASFEAIALPSLETRTTSISNDSLTTEKKATEGQEKRKENPNGGSQTTSTIQDDEETILVLDEIGRMELHSKPFSDRVRDLLMIGEGENHNNHNGGRRRCRRLVGAITAPIYGHRVPFCDEVAAQEGVEVHKLTKKTRDRVVQELLQSIENKGWCR